MPVLPESTVFAIMNVLRLPSAFLMLALPLFLLVACGDDPESSSLPPDATGSDVLVHACMQSEGTVPELCRCVVGVMEQEFTAQEFAILVQAARETPDLSVQVEGIDDQTMARVLMAAFAACNQ